MSISRLVIFCGVLCLHYVVMARALEAVKHMKDYAKGVINHCQNKIGISEDLLRQVHAGDFPNDPLFKCYLFCVLDRMGIMDEDNIIHLDYFLEILPEEWHAVVNNLLSQCGAKGGVDKCEIAFNAIKCYFEVEGDNIRKALPY